MAPLLTQSAAMSALPTLRAATDLAVLGGQHHGPGGRGEARGYPEVATSSPQSYPPAPSGEQGHRRQILARAIVVAVQGGQRRHLEVGHVGTAAAPRCVLG
jgi:hypothetical protein